MSGDGPADGEAAIRRWLQGTIGERIGRAGDEIDPDEPIHRFGIDSLERVNVAYELARWLGRPVDEATLAEMQTINQVARHLASSPTGS